MDVHDKIGLPKASHLINYSGNVIYSGSGGVRDVIDVLLRCKYHLDNQCRFMIQMEKFYQQII